MDFAVDKAHRGRKRRREKLGVVDVAEGAKADRSSQGLFTESIFGFHALSDRLSHLIAAIARGFAPCVPHRLIIPAGPMTRHLGPELWTKHVDDDALAGSVIEKVDQVTQNQKGFTTANHGTKCIEGTVHIGDQQHDY